MAEATPFATVALQTERVPEEPTWPVNAVFCGGITWFCGGNSDGIMLILLDSGTEFSQNHA